MSPQTARSDQSLYDNRQIRRAFSRAASGYDAVAALQRRVEARLLESLDYLDTRGDAKRTPQVVVDLGCGPGHAAATMHKRWPQAPAPAPATMHKRWPQAQVLALDLALPMLQQAQSPRRWHPLRRPVRRVCADARALPLADDSVDVLFSNLCLQWVEDLPAVFAGFRRVLRPGGLLLVSTFGPDTLHELRSAFAQADDVPHVSPFSGIAQFGDALMQAGFRDPVLDRDLEVTRYQDLRALMRELHAMGATNALQARRQSLTGKSRFARAALAYQQFANGEGLPASWETITAMSWAPQHGAPIREADAEIARFPVGGIPIRRR